MSAPGVARGRLKRVVGRWLPLTLALGGCATGTTPEQDLAYERWARCSAHRWVTLEWVAPDGRIGFMYTNAADRRDVVQCLSEASRTGPPLPAPTGVRPPSGP